MTDDIAKSLPLSTREAVEKAVSAAVTRAGAEYEIVEIRYTKEYGKLNVTVFVWKAEDDITLDDCEKVHNEVSDALDALDDLFDDDYILNVSSSGLDRPVVSDDDFRRALGTEIEVVADNEKFHGVLKSYDADSFTIVTGDKNPQDKTVLRNNKTKVQPYIRF